MASSYVDTWREQKEQAEGFRQDEDSWRMEYMPLLVAGAVFFAFVFIGRKIRRRK